MSQNYNDFTRQSNRFEFYFCFVIKLNSFFYEVQKESCLQFIEIRYLMIYYSLNFLEK